MKPTTSVLASGTVGGGSIGEAIRKGVEQARFLQPGDVVEHEVEGIGTLRNTIGPKEGYDPEYRALSVGIASKVFCVREAIDDGRRAVNFLRGNEEDKFQMGAEADPVTRLILSR